MSSSWGFTLVLVIWVTFMGGFWKDTPTYRVRDKNNLLLIREERSDDRSRFSPGLKRSGFEAGSTFTGQPLRGGCLTDKRTAPYGGRFMDSYRPSRAGCLSPPPSSGGVVGNRWRGCL
jgi:hypothetical protein